MVASPRSPLQLPSLASVGHRALGQRPSPLGGMLSSASHYFSSRRANEQQAGLLTGSCRCAATSSTARTPTLPKRSGTLATTSLPGEGCCPGHRAAMSPPRAAAQLLRMPASLEYSFPRVSPNARKLLALLEGGYVCSALPASRLQGMVVRRIGQWLAGSCAIASISAGRMPAAR